MNLKIYILESSRLEKEACNYVFRVYAKNKHHLGKLTKKIGWQERMKYTRVSSYI